jgi:hypothetical protein
MEYNDKGMERLLKVVIGTNKSKKVSEKVKSFYVPVKLKTDNVYNIIKIK